MHNTADTPSLTSPRVYPAGVTIVRNVARGPGVAPASLTIDDIGDWLLREAGRESGTLELVECFFWRLVAAGFPIDRASLHVGTLHPQLRGFAWNWRSSDGHCEEVKVQHGIDRTDSYRRNPLPRVFEQGHAVRCNPRDQAAQNEFPIMRELAEAGYHDYIALPLGSEGYRHAMTFATLREGGFDEPQIAQLKSLLDLFAFHVERHIADRIASNALGAYLGPSAAGKVLNGEIRRGGGEAIHAVIWLADLRGFTDLSDRLSGPDMVALLNAYFEVLAGAVLARGGDVLKFMGDGLLAVFPLQRNEGDGALADAALAAAEAAQRGLADLNANPPAALAAIDGWQPLCAGIALHEGEVFFGNIGAPERLDFTVIGPAVNEASRVEALQKALGRSVLVTAAAARLMTHPLECLGEFALRGVAAPMAIFSPAASGSPI